MARALESFHRALGCKFLSSYLNLPGLGPLAVNFKDQRTRRRSVLTFTCGNLNIQGARLLGNGQALLQRNSALVIEADTVIFVIWARGGPLRVDFEG